MHQLSPALSMLMYFSIKLKTKYCPLRSSGPQSEMKHLFEASKKKQSLLK